MIKTFDKRIIIVILSIIILIAIVTSWSSELAYVQDRLEGGANIERGTQIQAAINTRYTIWFVTVVFITFLLVYITSPKSN